MTARQVEHTWLALIALSFGLGGLAIFTFPSLSEGIYTVGVCTNLVLAVAMGVFVGWTRNWRQLGLAVFSGAFLTVVGTDLLDFVLPGASPSAAGDLFLFVSAIAICVAAVGMSILVGGAAVATILVRGVVRCIGNRQGMPARISGPSAFRELRSKRYEQLVGRAQAIANHLDIWVSPGSCLQQGPCSGRLRERV